MASISTMISLIVVLLATYSYSAPVVEHKNSTIESLADAENIVLGVQKQLSIDDLVEAVDIVLGVQNNSSISKPEHMRVHNKQRRVEDSSDPTVTDEQQTREIGDSMPTAINAQREIDDETTETVTEREVVDETSEREVDDETSESSTDISERSMDDDSSSIETMTERDVDDETSESSTDISERSMDEDTSVPSSSEMNHIERSMKDNLMLTDELKEKFDRRAIRPMQSDDTTEVYEHQPEKYTSEEPSSSVEPMTEIVEIIHDKQSSTSEYETTVTPIDEMTTPLSMENETTTKILAIIPGRLRKTQIIVNPVVEKPLSEGKY